MRRTEPYRCEGMRRQCSLLDRAGGSSRLQTCGASHRLRCLNSSSLRAPVSTNPFAEPHADLEVRNPAIADAERIRHEHLKAETNIKSIGLLYIVGGAFGTAGLVAMLVAAVISIFDKGMFGMGAGELVIVLVVLAIYPVTL